MRMAVCFLGLLNSLEFWNLGHGVMDRRNWIMDQRFIL